MKILEVTQKVSEDDCWLYAGSLTASGYGIVTITLPNNRHTSMVAHKAVFEAENGPIPRGLELDHLCYNKSCINPKHLEVVTHKENIVRYNHRSESCRNGHLYTLENIYMSRGTRDCRTCRKAAATRSFQRRKLSLVTT